MSGLRGIGQSIALSGSPVATLAAMVAESLAAGTVPCACPHPGAVSCLCLPSWILSCADCALPLQEAADQLQAPACAGCDAPATRISTWLAGQVLVIARLCDPHLLAGNMPASLN